MFEFIFDPNNLFVWILILFIIIGAIAVIFRPFRSYIQFVYPNAKYEAMGNPYIQQGTLEKLIETENITQFIEQINTDKDYTIEGSTSSEIQKQFDDHYMHQIQLMSKEQGKKMQGFLQIYLEWKQAHIIKELFRDFHQKKPIDVEHLLKKSVTPRLHKFIQDMSIADEESLSDILLFYGFDISLITLIKSEETVPLQIDAAVDHYFIKKMKSTPVPYKCKEAIQEYLSRLIDIQNIQHLLRAKHMQYHEKLCVLLYIDEGNEILSWKYQELCNIDTIQEIIESLEGTSYYQTLKGIGETNDISTSVQPFITALDQYLLSLLRTISQSYYVSIGPTLRFLISKEAEIKNLKIISKGISEKLSSEHIKPLLIMEAPL